MPSSISTITESPSSLTATAPGPNMLIVYETLSAALWATEIVMRLFRQLKDCPTPRASALPFSSMEDLPIRSPATIDALSSDLLVITASSAQRHFPAPVEQWVETCLATPRRSPCAVAALLRSDSIPDDPYSPRIQFLRKLARAKGCVFLAPFEKKLLVMAGSDSEAIASGTTSAPFSGKLFETRLASLFRRGARGRMPVTGLGLGGDILPAGPNPGSSRRAPLC